MKEEVQMSKIRQALLKKALGYDCDEIIEEYVIDEEGNEKLSKRRITKKYISPDIPAAKVLLESCIEQSSKYENMTDEQLQEEKLKLIKLLKNGDEDGN